MICKFEGGIGLCQVIDKKRLEIFLEVLDEVDAETADVEEIDRLIQMIDEIEKKLEQFKSNDR